ncbi:hypothetical protein BMS3Bbin04_00284 [bacterium BMS3Bbin04]|nr:hypothetical protein BMS3Bbin04_00284 [bacterium BMS3Bbin04]
MAVQSWVRKCAVPAIYQLIKSTTKHVQHTRGWKISEKLTRIPHTIIFARDWIAKIGERLPCIIPQVTVPKWLGCVFGCIRVVYQITAVNPTIQVLVVITLTIILTPVAVEIRERFKPITSVYYAVRIVIEPGPLAIRNQGIFKWLPTVKNTVAVRVLETFAIPATIVVDILLAQLWFRRIPNTVAVQVVVSVPRIVHSNIVRTRYRINNV